jgi:hypothetical protein
MMGGAMTSAPGFGVEPTPWDAVQMGGVGGDPST